MHLLDDSDTMVIAIDPGRITGLVAVRGDPSSQKLVLAEVLLTKAERFDELVEWTITSIKNIRARFLKDRIYVVVEACSGEGLTSVLIDKVWKNTDVIMVRDHNDAGRRAPDGRNQFGWSTRRNLKLAYYWTTAYLMAQGAINISTAASSTSSMHLAELRNQLLNYRAIATTPLAFRSNGPVTAPASDDTLAFAFTLAVWQHVRLFATCTVPAAPTDPIEFVDQTSKYMITASEKCFQ